MIGVYFAMCYEWWYLSLLLELYWVETHRAIWYAANPNTSNNDIYTSMNFALVATVALATSAGFARAGNWLSMNAKAIFSHQSQTAATTGRKLTHRAQPCFHR